MGPEDRMRHTCAWCGLCYEVFQLEIETKDILGRLSSADRRDGVKQHCFLESCTVWSQQRRLTGRGSRGRQGLRRLSLQP